MAKSKLKGPRAAPATIDLYGVSGHFEIPGSSFVIRYLSTYASTKGEPGHVALLRELMPMRERVKASELKDLTSLLQRDLNDERVSRELVPYLLGKRSSIGFFPAVLAVLVPKLFISNSPQAEYPAARTDGLATYYGEYWSFHRYELEDREVPLAMVKVAIPATDIIVLDGQHRASAFRRVAGLFPPGDSIYEAFYGALDRDIAFNAQLPVTLIWFEAKGNNKISPQLISRQLFVDVNNNAREVSKARTILLDDRHVCAIATQEVYRFAAEVGFAPERFSLLHSAFDMGVDLADRSIPAFSITTPEIIDDSLRWAFFGSTTYDSLSTWAVQRMLDQHNRGRFLTLFPDVTDVELYGDDDELRSPLLRKPETVSAFRPNFEQQYRPILCEMLGDLGFLSSHYNACLETDRWVHKSGNSTIKTVWSKVFRGGEGLYWIMRRSDGSGVLASYSSAIDEIEGEFHKRRASHFGDVKIRTVNAAYDAFRSKAFQIGYLMAVDRLASNTGDWIESSHSLKAMLDTFSGEQWVAALTEFRQLILGSGGTTPRTWPAHRNILLRMFDNGKGDIYAESNWEELPEWRACTTLLDKAAGSLVATNDTVPSGKTIRKHSDGAIKTIEAMMRSIGLKDVISQDTLSDKAFSHLKNLLNDEFGVMS